MSLSPVSCLLPLFLVFSFLIWSPVCVTGFSSGTLPYCDLGTSRLYGTGSLMNWARQPAPTNLFTIRSGDEDPSNDPVTYTAGSQVAIHIRGLSQTRYLGIVLYAIRGSADSPNAATDIGTQVGSWTVTPGSPFKIISPPGKGTCVVHQNAEYKPLHTVFYWNAPSGLGTVRFRVLLKIGEQNKGAFVYPTQQLVLNEGFPAELPAPVVISRNNESCSQACRRVYAGQSGTAQPKYCDQAKTSNILRSANLTNHFSGTTCRMPYFVVCSPSAPFQDIALGYCAFNSPYVCSQSALQGNCRASEVQKQRYCVCTSIASAADIAEESAAGAGGGGGGPTSGSGSSTTSQPVSKSDDVAISDAEIGYAVGFSIVLTIILFIGVGLWQKKRNEQRLKEAELLEVETQMDSTTSDSATSPMRSSYSGLERVKPIMPPARV